MKHCEMCYLRCWLLTGTRVSSTSGACVQSTSSISSDIDAGGCGMQKVCLHFSLTSKVPSSIGKAHPFSRILLVAALAFVLKQAAYGGNSVSLLSKEPANGFSKLEKLCECRVVNTQKKSNKEKTVSKAVAGLINLACIRLCALCKF